MIAAYPAATGDIVRAGGQSVSWLEPPGSAVLPFVAAYRCRFTLPEAATLHLHASADERYELFLEGRRVGRGPERGTPRLWFYERYHLPVAAGEHVLVARVWALGPLAPVAQMSAAPGFVLVAVPPFDTLLTTGAAPWETKHLDGYTFTAEASIPHAAWFTGANIEIDGTRFPWGVEAGEGEGWEPARTRQEDMPDYWGSPAPHTLAPAFLPPMLDIPRQAGRVRHVSAVASANTGARAIERADDLMEEHAAWQAPVDGQDSITVPPHTRRRVILDLNDYYCAYPRLVTSGGRGAAISLRWAEALYLDPQGRHKGQRDAVDGLYMIALSDDVFRPDGGAKRLFESLWWRAGRFLECVVETAEEPLILDELALRETRYPLEMESRFDADDARMRGFVPIALRGLQMCAHETYMDCPYYEQLMYAGDTRLEALATYVISRDDRLPRKALALFDASRLPNGLTQSRYPSRHPQTIPPFALWWVAMVYDYALWRDDPVFVASLLPGVRAVLDGYLRSLDADGVVVGPPGWNYVDWVPDWPNGIPPGAASDANATITWQLVGALGMAARLEEWVGEPEPAARARRQARAVADCCTAVFWDDERDLFADDREKRHFSEHAQCLALLSGELDTGRQERLATSLLQAQDLARTTIYFTHYLFEAYHLLGADGALFDRLGLWFGLADQGFKTPPEAPEPTRSDCHGWGAHPLYHLFATVLGIRPAAFGFRTVEIAPQLGPLHSARGHLVHPRGTIEVDLRVEGDRLSGEIALPDGVGGVLRYKRQTQPLAPGRQRV